MIEKVIENALIKFFESERGETLIGNIVIKAVDQAMIRKVQFEDSKSEPGRIIEKTEEWNILDWIAKYFPYMEGALRGVQSDAAQARNRSVEVKDVLTKVMKQQAEIIDLPQVRRIENKGT